MNKKWKRIIIHCSDSFWGSAPEVREWHVKGNGWSDIGYHYLILNGKLKSKYYLDCCDGSIEIGRRIDGDMIAEKEEAGAHAYGYNSDSIGICLVGKEKFTTNQISSLLKLILDLMNKFEIPIQKVIGHYEIDPKKTCPNYDMNILRYTLEQLSH